MSFMTSQRDDWSHAWEVRERDKRVNSFLRFTCATFPSATLCGATPVMRTHQRSEDKNPGEERNRLMFLD